ncbi:hypothetical protein L323_13825 [Ruminiclostridium papyrosolvens C7]|uniref:Uncharacterized protein n=1 Tax=Ruminiclostridium papyrosolvens C7 TaxID=1330534 RepID=U4R0D4_9FIRM|nr:hypothetical protein L323_13825 [Ruminiclostridium papyrosolvens C7]
MFPSEFCDDQNLVNFIKKCINNNIYVSGIWNEFFIPSKLGYKNFNFERNYLIYGFDDDTKSFLASGYISDDLVDDNFLASTNTVLDHITFIHDRLKYIFRLTEQNIRIFTLSNEIMDLISELKKTINSLYINIKLSENDKIYYIQKFTYILDKEKDILYEICLNLSRQ